MSTEPSSSTMPWPFDGRSHRITLGLAPLPLAQWLMVDESRETELDLKASLLDERHADVLAALPMGLAGSRETLDLVRDHLRGLRLAGPDGEDTDPDPTRHPLESAARLIQEDLAIMVRTEDAWVLGAACICFPSHWHLRDKIGRSLGEIHAPVPGLADAIGAEMNRFFDRITPERPVCRTNWTLHPGPSLFSPPGHPEPPIPDGAPVQERWWLRVERQTLRRLSRSNAVLFTIRTFRARVDRAVTTPEAATAMAATLRRLPTEHLAYKGVGHDRDALLTWCAARGGD